MTDDFKCRLLEDVIDTSLGDFKDELPVKITLNMTLEVIF